MDTQLLFIAAQFAQMIMPAGYDGSTERCVVMTPESSILDLILCLENSPSSKREKRVARLKFLLKFFGKTISNETFLRVLKLVKLLKDTPAEDNQLNEPTLEQLIEDVQKCHMDCSNGIVFNKMPKDQPFVPSLKQAFHDACKSVVNHDGQVYDVFAAVAIISFEELLNSNTQNSQLRSILLSRAKLIFKGGASIGKFLFKGNSDLWNSMIENDKAFVMSNFINGGDNDTGLTFSMPENVEYDVEQVNNEIGSILYDMQLIAMENVKRYNVEQIISSYIDKVSESTLAFAGHQFSFESRKATSFAITEKNELQNEILFTGTSAERVFGSISYLQFSGANGNTIKFFLGRVKAAFTANLNNMKTQKNNINNININCYAECLDISATCIDSAVGFKSTYQPANFMSLVKVSQ